MNNHLQGKKILSSLSEELETCEAFDFSVAFINDTGLASIMQKLEYLADHNIKGRILTTNYLNFTTPGSLSKLLEFPNIELRVYTKGGFHPKGYIFKQSNYYSMIIGSANLTASALSHNQEWSIKFLSLTDGQIVHSVQKEFERVWNDAEIVTNDWIENYKIDYNQKKVKLINTKKEEIEEFQLENENIPDQHKYKIFHFRTLKNTKHSPNFHPEYEKLIPPEIFCIESSSFSKT